MNEYLQKVHNLFVVCSDGFVYNKNELKFQVNCYICLSPLSGCS